MNDAVNVTRHLAAFPFLTNASSERANLAARASGTLLHEFCGSRLEARIQPGPAPARAWSIAIELDEQLFTIALSQTTLLAVLAMVEPSLALQPPPLPSILALLADTLLGDVVTRMGTALGGTAVLVGTAGGQAGTPDGVAVKFSMAEMPHRLTLNGLDPVDRILRAWPVRQHGLSQLRFPCWVSLGSTELPVSIVRDLEVGDALRIEHRHGQKGSPKPVAGRPGQALLVVCGEWSAAVHERGHQWTVLEPLGPPNPTWKENEVADRDGGSIESLPVRLEFNVGHRELSLAELRLLQPGAVLTLGRSPSDLIEITVHGRRIGIGELVDVEGVTAVRIKRLFGLD